MRNTLAESIKGAIRPALYRLTRPGADRYTCPICRYTGPMKPKNMGPPSHLTRQHSKCPRCAAVERHRLQSLVLDELLPTFNTAHKAILHIAPERCLQHRLRDAFATYHTMDLLRSDVDYNDDVQNMSFPDASYHMVFISRVLSIPPDYRAALREIRRVLAPGGVAVISEYLDRPKTQPDPDPATEAAWFFGADILDDYADAFERVETRSSDQYPPEHQLINLFTKDAAPYDHAPDPLRAPGKGIKEILALCYAEPASSS